MIRVGVLYGGNSLEYEVSLRSAETIIQHLNPHQFEIIPIHINRQSQWIIYDNLALSIDDCSSRISQPSPKAYPSIPDTLPCNVIFSLCMDG